MKSLDYSSSVVLLSGGLDSTCALIQTKLDFTGAVYALSIQYGQRHVNEVAKAIEIAQALMIPIKVLDLTQLGGLLAGSALLSPCAEIPKGHYKDLTMKATVVPNRNMILLALAGGYAIAQGVGNVVIAAHAGDHAIYPDCRQEFLDAMNRALGVCHYEPVMIQRPFVQLSKAELLSQTITNSWANLGFRSEQAMASFLGVHTWSCYEGKEFHCGRCGTCVERKEAFAESSYIDTTVYLESTS